jgi:hypothetical protein
MPEEVMVRGVSSVGRKKGAEKGDKSNNQP